MVRTMPSGIGDSCTHVGGPLSEGEVVGKVVTFPLHFAQFDVTTGGDADDS